MCEEIKSDTKTLELNLNEICTTLNVNQDWMKNASRLDYNAYLNDRERAQEMTNRARNENLVGISLNNTPRVFVHSIFVSQVFNSGE